MSRQHGTKALDQNRTDDLILTKDALCQLSYEGVHERETGFEPAAYSLEGYSSSQLSYSRIP